MIRNLLTLTALRYKAGLTQLKLSQLSGVPQSVISNYERGLRVYPDHMELLIQALQQCMPPSVDLRRLAREDLTRSWSSVEIWFQPS